MKNKNGFSVLELLVSMFVLAMGLMGIIGGIFFVQQQTDKTIKEYSVFNAGGHYLQQLKLQPLNDEVLASNEITVSQPNGDPITLTLNEWNDVDPLDFTGDTVNANDDLELQVMPVISEIDNTTGNYYSVALNYQWRQAGATEWTSEKMTSMVTLNEEFSAGSSKAATFYSPNTIVTVSGDTVELKVVNHSSYRHEEFLADGISDPELRAQYLEMYQEQIGAFEELNPTDQEIDDLVTLLQSGNLNNMVVNEEFFTYRNDSSDPYVAQAFHDAIGSTINIQHMDMLLGRLGVSRETYNDFMNKLVHRFGIMTVKEGEVTEESVQRNVN